MHHPTLMKSYNWNSANPYYGNLLNAVVSCRCVTRLNPEDQGIHIPTTLFDDDDRENWEQTRKTYEALLNLGVDPELIVGEEVTGDIIWNTSKIKVDYKSRSSMDVLYELKNAADHLKNKRASQRCQELIRVATASIAKKSHFSGLPKSAGPGGPSNSASSDGEHLDFFRRASEEEDFYDAVFRCKHPFC